MESKRSKAQNLKEVGGRDKMVDIECLACGKTTKIPKFIDTADYDGQLVCQKCKSILHVKFMNGKVQKYKIVESKTKLNWVELIKSLDEEKAIED